MSKQSHCLDGLLGKQMVSTLPIPERRKTPDQLRRMDHVDRLLYERHAPPLSEQEKCEALEREDLRHRLGMGDDELSWQDLDRLSDDYGGDPL